MIPSESSPDLLPTVVATQLNFTTTTMLRAHLPLPHPIFGLNSFPSLIQEGEGSIYP